MALHSTLRELPDISTNPARPEHIPARIAQYNANISPETIRINHL
jgi:hypothetical protein